MPNQISRRKRARHKCCKVKRWKIPRKRAAFPPVCNKNCKNRMLEILQGKRTVFAPGLHQRAKNTNNPKICCQQLVGEKRAAFPTFLNRVYWRKPCNFIRIREIDFSGNNGQNQKRDRMGQFFVEKNAFSPVCTPRCWKKNFCLCFTHSYLSRVPLPLSCPSWLLSNWWCGPSALAALQLATSSQHLHPHIRQLCFHTASRAELDTNCLERRYVMKKKLTHNEAHVVELVVHGWWWVDDPPAHPPSPLI